MPAEGAVEVIASQLYGQVNLVEVAQAAGTADRIGPADLA
ncbi:MAG: hypothetical protein BWY91_01686 [bacterium ADurb.BinA028]|nr:MAG: hypothetical protein BWY91_01686 [bacterium ADurb.BinA028]